MHGALKILKVAHRHRQRRSTRRYFRHGQRAAALRAITAAKLYAAGAIPSLALAAASCGSNVQYVKAAVTLLKSEARLDSVLKGHIPLLGAATQAKRVADLVSAYRSANDQERVAFARACNAEKIFEVLVKAVA
jgi:hypothetical protein